MTKNLKLSGYTLIFKFLHHYSVSKQRSSAVKSNFNLTFSELYELADSRVGLIVGGVFWYFWYVSIYVDAFLGNRIFMFVSFAHSFAAINRLCSLCFPTFYFRIFTSKNTIRILIGFCIYNVWHFVLSQFGKSYDIWDFILLKHDLVLTCTLIFLIQHF